MKINIVNTIVLLGSIQGFMLAAFFLLNKKLNQKSNLFLALLLLSFSLVNLANCLWDIGFSKEQLVLQHLPLNWTLMIPFALYYFVQYLINPAYKFSAKEYILLLPFFVQQLQKLVQLYLYMSNKQLLKEWEPFFTPLIKGLEITAILYCVIVFMLSIKKINKFQQQLQNQFANIENRSLGWIKNILSKVVFLLILWIVPYVFAAIYKKDVNNYMYPLWLAMTIVVYWLAWSMFNRRDLFEYTPPEILEPEKVTILDTAVEPIQKKEKNIPESWEQHYVQLSLLMEKEQLYLDFDINMSSLSKKMGLSNGYLSQIINKKDGQNFYDYINTYRVKAVQEKLANPAFHHLSMYGIALDCGFKSKSTFNAVFKKVTGFTPSEYKNQLSTASSSINS